MALRLLLDEHISLAVAVDLRRRGMDVVAMQEWRNGNFLSRLDPDILSAANEDQRILVTYDVHTIPGFARSLVESGSGHAGIIYVSQKTVQAHQIGRLSEALFRFASEQENQAWLKRAEFLRE